MTTNQPLSLFVSSRMKELVKERQSIRDFFNRSGLLHYFIAWLWEKDAGARPEPIRSTYLKEVEACDIYIGLFWQGYGQYTIDEYRHARALKKPCLVYQKDFDIHPRDPQLTSFLHEINQVENPEGLTVWSFRNHETPEQMAQKIQDDVMHLLITQFRERRKQPATAREQGKPTIKVKDHSIGGIIDNRGGTINQTNN